MNTTVDEVREGKGGELNRGFGLCADGQPHPAEEAGWALVGGADPREIAEALKAMADRRAENEGANADGMHQDI